MSDIYVFDLENSFWDIYKPKNQPQELHGSLFKGFLMSGSNYFVMFSENLYQFYVLDLENNEWLNINAEGYAPTKRKFYSITSFDYNKILFFGGSDGNELYNDGFILEYDKNLHFYWDSINLKGKIPKKRMNHAIVGINQNLVLFGGATKVEGVKENTFTFEG